MKQSAWVRKLINFLNIRGELNDFALIHAEIESDLIFKGAKLWILVFAILVASVGLNMNSTAVVIGAMLISPLMGPINGLGYSIATYDFNLFRKALKNFLFAIVTGLIASTLYFLISPIDTAYSEILSRTSPTIYDVIIAFFGGAAGIIAISSKYKGNVIPGVAIATALMPPLCTAGYGLATGQFFYFFGAFYLFTINTVFIAIAALIVSQLLKFPMHKKVDNHRKAVINRWISVVIILVLIPSIYFGYQLVKKEQFTKNAAKFIKDIRIIEGNYLMKEEVFANNRSIRLTYGGTKLSDDVKKSILDKTEIFDLDKTKIEFKQGLTFKDLDQKGEEVNNLRLQINQLSYLLTLKDKHIDSLQNRKQLGKTLLLEIRAFFPQITACTYTDALQFSNNTKKVEKNAIVILKVKPKILNSAEETKIFKWLSVRLKVDNLKVFYENDTLDQTTK